MTLPQTSNLSLSKNAASLRGLTAAEVEERINKGEVNALVEQTSRTYKAILSANIFTLFNAVLSALLALVLIFGSIKDALFGIILIINPLIGIIQEIRAKITLDRLVLLNAPKVYVVRDGQTAELSAKEIVIDDLIQLRTGDQVMVDGEVSNSEALEIDESLLSGESVPIQKNQGDAILSGSFVVAGAGKFKVTKIGKQTYAQQLKTEARQFTGTRSELIIGINKFLRYIIWAMVVVAPLLFITQFRAFGSIRNAFPTTVAGLVGMVPQGLVLLTSITFAVSVIKLGRRRVLVQELPAVEGLARVDVMCFDKTGTLTKDAIVFQRLEKIDEQSDVEQVLQAFSQVSSPNTTLTALAAAFQSDKVSTAKIAVPFSSERKWSALSLDGKQTWILGAPEILLEKLPDRQSLLSKSASWAESGTRVLLLGWTQEKITSAQIPAKFAPAAFLLFEEQIREDAPATLDYFKQQNITLKIISGDNPKTVAAVAARAGLTDFGEPIDARHLPDDLQALSQIVETNSIFGRVKPQQKRQMIKALQSKGHVVAMTGDGVNDVLALKEADLGIAMGKGAPATKAVAHIVLLDSKFSTLPVVMAEGRKVIANIERVADLFLTKTIYVTLLAVAVGSMVWTFPFLPRHLTLIDGLTIGIPAFFLALAPNTERYRSGFTVRVLRFIIPAGLIAAAASFTVYGLARAQAAGQEVQSTAALLSLTIVSFWVLGILSRPLIFWRKILLITMLGLFAAVMALPWTRHFFILEFPGFLIFMETIALTILFIGLLELIFKFSRFERFK